MQRAWRVTLIAALAVLSSCGANNPRTPGGTVDSDSSNTVATVTPPAAATPPPSGATMLAASLAGETGIADNFDGAAMLEPTWYGPTGRGGIAPINPDPVGAFRFFCAPGQLLKDDPIFLPGQPGKSHLHQFIGNTAADANSTYQSLRTKGGSTCDNRSIPDKAFNRSAYWMPAMLDGEGNAVRPDYVLVYYKRVPASSPACGAPDATHIGYCTDMPNGIKFTFGYDMKTMTGGPMQPGFDRDGETFECLEHTGSGERAGSATGLYHSLQEAVQGGCPAGSLMHISITPPTCWDGKTIDAADHRSNVVYADGPLVVSAGERSCPADHPYFLPNLAYQWYFTTNAAFVAGHWRLSSDDMMSQMTGKTVIPGSTLHMDYFEGWSPTIKAAFHGNCIDKHENCNNGDLGNGIEMKESQVPPGFFPVPAPVALSSIP
jgi:hypothetical protein